MSEELGRYYACPTNILVSPTQLLKRKSLRDIRDPEYRAPTFAEIRSVFNIFGMNQNDIAESLGVSVKTVQTWVVDSEKPSHIPIPYSIWRLCLHEAMLIQPHAVTLKSLKGLKTG